MMYCFENDGPAHNLRVSVGEVESTVFSIYILPLSVSRFCVGDKFFLKNNMILCQTDYEEGLMKEGYAPQVR